MWLKTDRRKERLLFIVLAILGLIVLLPFFFILLNSFKTFSDLMTNFLGWPNPFTLENFRDVFSILNYTTAVRNTLAVTLVSVTVTIFLSSITGHTLRRTPGRGSRWIYSFFVLGMAIPFHSLMVPLLQTMKDLNALNSLATLALVYIAFNLPFSVFLYYGFAASIPFEIEEAAIIDGCKPTRMFFGIVFPLLKPATFTAAVLFFMWNWNEFMLSYLMVTKQSLRTLMPELMTCVGNNRTDWNLFLAAVAMAALPVLVFYVFAQKYIIKGLVLGSVKG